MDPRENAPGFTVIELLAVVSLLSLVMALGAVRLGVATDEAHLSRALADLLEMDARARLLGRSDGAVSLSLESEPKRLVLVRARGGDVLQSTVLPRDASVRLTDPGSRAPLNEIRFDRAGRSCDYEVEVRLGEHQARRTVAGLTGLVEKGGDEP